ncbi:uncharacterized protein LOC119400937 [Rhipicephalus sanguineus]|uniref:uncharacterized protein LOC119400937 n=1 Tax=Rhipicephalus sanguineus TaxID=34632 RepID=UPI0018937503|nr:uncharacterized protein LOC119400937 [Rhipicephalus sanguineus]
MGGVISWLRGDEDEVFLEEDETFATENVTVVRGICLFNDRNITDRHTIRMRIPCVEATCWAPSKVVFLNKCPSVNSGEGRICRMTYGVHDVYPSCCDVCR